MIRYDWLEIKTSEDYGQLVHTLEEEFQPATIAKQLQSSITDSVGGILVEHGYVDKDYRSTFYNFYAKKGRVYRNDCVRLHFFDGSVNFDPTRTDFVCTPSALQESYFGYIVLRPTLAGTLGRSVLSPRIRVGAKGSAIQAQHRVHLLGYTLSVWGFPSMAQHRDIAVCAHVSCWAILRHYSERFSQHREFLIHDITKLATPFDPGGLAPALGLNDFHAERIFQSAGCFPLIVVKKNGADAPNFYAQLLAYLESGFPLYVAMPGRTHAIVAAGYAWQDSGIQSSASNSHVWSQIDTVLAIDDHHLPYDSVRLRASVSQDSPAYTAQDFKAFIVPLPEKIYYPANAMELYSKTILYKLLGSTLNVPSEDVLLRRYFITTISSLRRYARENLTSMGDELVNLLMRLDTAQFIWVVEYVSQDQWARRHIAARAIVDATASPHDSVPVWLAHDEELAIVFDRSSAKPGARLLPLNRPAGSPLGRMELNLGQVRT